MYGKSMRAAEIARKLGCTREWIRQILVGEGLESRQDLIMACPRCSRPANVRLGACAGCLRTAAAHGCSL